MDNKQLLIEFKELINYGTDQLSQANIKFKNFRAKKRLLFFMMGVTQSYTKSIFKLLNPPHIYDKSAEVIFRSLFENFINMSYVFTGRSDKKAIIFAIQPILDDIRFANKYKDLMIKYPEWKLAFNSSIKTTADWDTFISNQRKQILKIEKKYKIIAPIKYPDLIDRAREHDEILRQKGNLKLSNSLEFYYTYYYKYFSDPVHLNSSGIERFLDGEEKIIKFDIDAPIENITRILSISFLFYLIFLKFYLVQFGIYKKEEFIQFNKIRKIILSRNK